MYSTTKKQFEYFGERVKYWQNFWHLGNWRIDIYMGETGDNYAFFVANHAGKCASITLCRESDYKLNEIKLDRSAFHEVSEIMLSALGSYAEEAVAKGIVQEAVHDVIRRLEHIVFPKMWDIGEEKK